MEGRFAFSYMLQDGKESVYTSKLFSKNGLLHHRPLSHLPEVHDN